MWVEQIAGPLWQRQDDAALIVRAFARFYAMLPGSGRAFGPYRDLTLAQQSIDGALSQ